MTCNLFITVFRRRAAALCVVALVVTPIAGRADGTAALSMCASGTTVVFSCSTAKGKVVSLCGAPPAALQYRFGTVSRLEMAFPANPAEGANRMRLALYARAQAQRATVTFENQAVSYSLFDGSDRGVRRAGVSVQLPGADTETLFVCRGPISGALALLEPYLPCDAESALQGGSCR